MPKIRLEAQVTNISETMAGISHQVFYQSANQAWFCVNIGNKGKTSLRESSVKLFALVPEVFDYTHNYVAARNQATLSARRPNGSPIPEILPKAYNSIERIVLLHVARTPHTIFIEFPAYHEFDGKWQKFEQTEQELHEFAFGSLTDSVSKESKELLVEIKLLVSGKSDIWSQQKKALYYVTIPNFGSPECDMSKATITENR